MNGHHWCQVAESEVRATGQKAKKQWLWRCPRCGQSTVVDDGQDPEVMKELYGIEPLELDGTTILDPLIESCDNELISSVMRS